MKKKLYISMFMWAIASVLMLRAQHVFIVHTSDTHSCVEPISPNYGDTAQADKAGFMRRAVLVNQLRQEYPELLLLDCGDFSQGSVYYNLFKGEVEVRLMNEMKYDVCTIGNHEFDFGLENMARLMQMADFPFVCSNYDFRDTPCAGLVKPYVVLERGGVRIGILGVCPNPEGLITKENYGKMRYSDPIVAAQSVIDVLRGKERCDLVICMSHLGWGNTADQDPAFIAATSGIDILLGGHTHTYFDHMVSLKDKQGHEVQVEHMGKNARFVGTMEVTLE